ncbi:hypothetical protein VMCG_09960 [Cytospora schulzeri]|uniref:Uncharacterized protein n=1 Tax=Cytospora schulzeri TaxID=448051 RepID=A0A423VJ23_9PEZI|nr:hypothetical protein VMCG_09960 [Valsa malicola]
MTLLWTWSGFAFTRERTPRLDATLRQAQPYSSAHGDVATSNAVACLRVLVALRQFRDLPGLDRDVGLLLGWGHDNLVSPFQARLIQGRERYLARHRGRWRTQPRISWRITATRVAYYHHCLDAMRVIIATPGTILDLTPATTTNPALPRPPRPDWFRPRTRGTRHEEMEIRQEIERGLGLGLGLGASAGSSFELPLRPGGHGIPQLQPEPEPQQTATPAAATAIDAALVNAGPSFSLPLRQRDGEKGEESKRNGGQ